MTTLKRERLPAGAVRSGPGALWALVLDGAATLETAGALSAVRPGDAVLVDARTAHRLTADVETDLVHADLWRVSPAVPMPSPLVVHRFSERQRGVAALVTSCPLDVKCSPDLFRASYASLIGVAMAVLWAETEGVDVGAAGGTGTAVDPQVAQVVAALVARPGEPWTLDRMAGLVHLSRSTLAERFRRATGHSPMRMLREVRMDRARTLLADGHLPVTRVAFEVGYGSVAAFSRAFAADHGASPLAWRAPGTAAASGPTTASGTAATQAPARKRPVRPWVPSAPLGRSAAGRAQDRPADPGGHRRDRPHYQQQPDTVPVQ